MADDLTISWTAQHRYLWTGRRDGMPAGTIEHGLHFTYIDVTGAEYHGFRTLEQAQEAAERFAREFIR